MLGRRAAASTSTAASASRSGPARTDAHAAAFGDERAGAREPEPAARAGDDRNFVGEPERSMRYCDASAGQIVQPPVERMKRHLELVLLHELLLERQQVRADERDDGALDRRSLRRAARRALVVAGDELRLAPAEDRRQRHLVRDARSILSIVCSDTNSFWMSSSCCVRRSPVYASLRSRPLPTAPRPSAR